MSIAYTDKNYIYAVSRIRSAELRLLDHSVFDRLCEAGDTDECRTILAEKGFGGGLEDADELLAFERRKLWDLIAELVPDTSVFDVFRLSGDYDNLKAAIKESVLDEEMPGIYTEEASLDPMLIRRAVRERNYRLLPGSMAELAGECHGIFLRTRDGQLCDIMIDRAALAAMQEAAARTGDAVLKSYASIRAAAADIKIASRAVMTRKDETFLDRALAECDGLDREKLIKAAASGMEGIYAYLENTDFSDAIPELRRSQAAFERWCDDKIIREIKPQLWNSFGLGPIAAYIIARETEIRSVRILLAAKQNGFPEDMIRERIRETYV